MDNETAALFAIGLTLLALLATAVARRTALPDPVVLCLAGAAASTLPGLPDLDLPPDLVFLVFLPALLYRSSFLTSPQVLRRHATPIALLSVGLVLATAFAVAAVASVVVPGVGVAEGLVLGAIVAPTDPVAAAGVFARLGAPRRVVDLVEGESLVNDATALVLFGLAVEAVVSGPPTATEAVGRLALSVAGGVVVGLLVALVVSAVRRHLRDVGLQLGLSLLTPYLAYVPADAVEASGVLAVVTTGVVLGARAEGLFSPAVRLQSAALWSLVDLLLNAVLFLLLGLQVRRVLDDAPDVGLALVAVAAGAVVVTVLGLRIAWQFVVPPLLYRVRVLAGRPEQRTGPGERLLIGWSGMRGAVSLAAALAVPLEADGEPFPGRAVILVVTVSVILSTLVLQATTLGAVLRRVRTSDRSEEERQERAARTALADVALARLDELEVSGEIPPGSAQPLRQVWEQARSRVVGEAREEGEADLVALRLDLVRVQGEELDRRRREGRLPPEVARALRAELDLQEVRLAQLPTV